jgi:hypothetical protein
VGAQLRESPQGGGFTVRGKAHVVALISALVLALVPMGTASAHTATFPTTLTIDKLPSGAVSAGEKVLVFGRLKPKKCRNQQAVTLWEKESGPDHKLGTDHLDKDGEYSFKLHPDSDIRVYAKVVRSVLVSNYQHSHTCAKDRSDTIGISVT